MLKLFAKTNTILKQCTVELRTAPTSKLLLCFGLGKNVANNLKPFRPSKIKFPNYATNCWHTLEWCLSLLSRCQISK